MKRIVSSLLVTILILLQITLLLSCTDESDGIPSDNTGDLNPGDQTPGGGDTTEKPNISIPELGELDRRTVKFDTIAYERPNVEALILGLSALAEDIRGEAKEYAELLSTLEALDVQAENYMTMMSYANIMVSKNSADGFFADEYVYLSGIHAEYSKTVEDLFVAAAGSPHMAAFETDYFGKDELLPYVNGGKYTDRVVTLMNSENSLESEYSTMSMANAVITYGTVTDTCESILNFYKRSYGEESWQYKLALVDCTRLYEEYVSKRSKEIFVNLVKVRIALANELGYESYTQMAYESNGCEYSEKEMKDFISDIKKYVLPVYQDLLYSVFIPYFYTATEYPLDGLMEKGYYLIEATDEDMARVYAYMMHYGLYDSAPENESRYIGSFSTYLDNYDAPYLFLTNDGTVDDYLTLFHEFGHFYDSFINNGDLSSLDIAEVSSTALELLCLTKIDKVLTEEELKYLVYSSYNQYFETLIYQGFYALFEHNIYAMEFDEVSEFSLNLAVKKAAVAMGLNRGYDNLDYVLIPHMFESPHYVQSYCTSATVAMEIYFMELASEGKGFEAYKSFINRGEEDMSYDEHLASAGLLSPFATERLRTISNSIYYAILGANFFADKQNTPNVA